VIGVFHSTPLVSLEAECSCPLIEIRNRWLAGKFLLKCYSTPDSDIFHCFQGISLSWRYVSKSLPVLAAVSVSLFPSVSFILRTQKRLALFNLDFADIMLSPEALIDPSLWGYSHSSLLNLPPAMVNNLFYSFISHSFPDSFLIFTDRRVSNRSAGCFFFIPSFSVSFYDNLPRFASSFSAECWATLLALHHIIHLSSNTFLIITDSQSTLYSNIASLFDYNPGHVGIEGNERADFVARDSRFIRTSPIHKILFSDVIPH